MSKTTPVVDPLARLGKGGVLLCFGASWCTPSVLLEPHLAALTEAGVDVRRVDVDTWPQHAESFRVVPLPTLVWVHGGAERRRHVGAIGLRELRAFTSRK